MQTTALKRALATALLCIAATTARVAGAPAPATLADAFTDGKFDLDARLRYESAEQTGLKDSDAFTLSTRLGFTTATFDGLQAMIEGENVSALNDTDAYNAAGTNPGGAGRTVIADPPKTDLNQAWLSYAAAGATVKAGRQRLVLDNARFVGDVGWRQNMQTFDAASLTLAPAKDFTFFYGYVWRVSRVFGDKAPQPDFTGNVNLFNASYTGLPFGKLTAYAYLLDFDNSPANSSNTYGASFAGAQAVSKTARLTYRLEAATQSGAGRNPVSYTANYWLAEVGATVAPFDFGAGYEAMGSDGGKKGFATPLATLHAFDGWADVFLNTPAKGLDDAYLSAGVALPGGFPVKVVYHDFSAAAGGASYGTEWDAVISHQLGAHWTLLAKLARFAGRAPYADVDRFWLQTEFKY